jgi:nicotinamidase/pyrazinamidase
VRFSAEDARRLGFETEVITAACRAIDLGGTADAARRSFAEHGVALT